MGIFSNIGKSKTDTASPTTSADPPKNEETTNSPVQAMDVSMKPSVLAAMNDMMSSKMSAVPSANDALNARIVQAVSFTNQEVTSYAASQIAIPPDMMISQASALVAQSAANYFDGTSKIAMASKSILLKNMTENILKKDVVGAAEDALGILVNDLMVGCSALVAAGSGAIEAEGANFAITKIDESIDKYKDLLSQSAAAKGSTT